MSIRRRKDPIHGIFTLCSQLTPDPTWSEFFKECSYGIFPTGVHYRNGSIVCSRKKNSFVVAIPDSPEKALPVLIEVFREKLCIRSVREKASQRIIFQNIQNEKTPQSWSAIRTRVGKKSALLNYVEALGDRFAMNTYEKEQALTLLEFCVNSGSIPGTKINVENGMIRFVEGFQFDPILRQSFYSGEIDLELDNTVYPEHLFCIPHQQIDIRDLYASALQEHSDKIKQSSVH